MTIMELRGTTILAVRTDAGVAMAGDGQVTLGQAIAIKHSARKVRRIYNDRALIGFAGATADAFTLFERFEAKLESCSGNLVRASVELAKDWRKDKYLRRLEAMGNALHFESIQVLINSLMQALATAIDARDPFTAGHSQRVARLGVALAKVVHQDVRFFQDVTFTPSDMEELLYAGLLHDVGKIGIREEVLTKATRLSVATMAVIGQRLALLTMLTGENLDAASETLRRINAADCVTREDTTFVVGLGAREIRVGERAMPILTEQEIACLLIPRGNLTPEERREIERHPAESHRILQHIPFPENMGRLLPIISQHHERLDGSGYPGGLKGPDILLQSRITAIVDIYDAITMARHYKPALPREKALGILWQEARAGRIDARLVELLDAHIVTIEQDCERLRQRIDFADYLQLQPTAAAGA